MNTFEQTRMRWRHTYITEIDSHLAGCPPCIEFVGSLRKTMELCRRHLSAELPEPIGRQALDQLVDAYQKMLAARRTTSPQAE
jgi:hypothetical protein